SWQVLLVTTFIFATLYISFFIFPLAKRFRLQSYHGLIIQAILLVFGAFISWGKDVRNHPQWYGHIYTDSQMLVVKLEEPLVKKEKTFKAIVAVEAILQSDAFIPAKGDLILYFTPDSINATLQYGDYLLVNKKLQPITNSGNPGAFNYRRYAAFQQQFHMAFIGKNNYVLLPQKNKNAFNQFIFQSRQQIISTLQKFLSKDKKIIGIAEALLIGYKQDLDKDLVQAYSNTGVVHIIAISGLHLGLIYAVLIYLFNILPFFKRSTFLKVISILTCLWLFSILTGSSASVLRSAVMFTCIVIGKNYFKQSSIYNSLAASAFILLCYNPYFLWDVGFQLSYLAVIGIVWLQRPIKNLLYTKMRLVNKVWEMVAVTLAAQVAAFPICIYYFHQFPNVFLLTNFITVPLSTIILFGEILLLLLSWLPSVAVIAGKVISYLIAFMNWVIERFDNLSWSVTDQIYANIYTTWLLYGLVFFVCAWLLYRKKIYLHFTLLCFLLFSALHARTYILSRQQLKVIVYNIPKMQGIDFIERRTYSFVGDSMLQAKGLFQNFHLKPARINLQVQPSSYNLYDAMAGQDIGIFHGKRILIVDKPLDYRPINPKILVDVLIISHSPNVTIEGLLNALQPGIIVFDASNSLWKIEKWKQSCSALLLPFHSVPEEGAFVFDINRRK
ncbi:MAG: ComEC/Rec2 family competence protein, partial [Ferruginibacter sp.]